MHSTESNLRLREACVEGASAPNTHTVAAEYRANNLDGDAMELAQQASRFFLGFLRNQWMAIIGSLIGGTISVAGMWIVHDFRAWKAFGTGGTPPTWAGYWRMTKIRILQAQSGEDMRDASSLSPSATSYLRGELPQRSESERPKIQSRTMPQRQHPTLIDETIKERLHALPKTLCSAHPELLKLDLSATEGRSTDAIYALQNQSAAQDRIIKNEIAHVHPAENSLHVWLSEADARHVIDRGWGERFPLSAMGMCHKGFTFVYAPRQESAMEDTVVIEGIVRAGVEFVTGKELK